MTEEDYKETKELMMSGLKIAYEVMASPELAEAVATMSKNLYDAFREKGFSDENSIKLTIGSMNNMNKK